jgi:hypothetical protein
MYAGTEGGGGMKKVSEIADLLGLPAVDCDKCKKNGSCNKVSENWSIISCKEYETATKESKGGEG